MSSVLFSGATNSDVSSPWPNPSQRLNSGNRAVWIVNDWATDVENGIRVSMDRENVNRMKTKKGKIGTVNIKKKDWDIFNIFSIAFHSRAIQNEYLLSVLLEK